MAAQIQQCLQIGQGVVQPPAAGAAVNVKLAAALLQPRLPDKGDCMTFDFSLPASTYLEEDLARLDRICR